MSKNAKLYFSEITQDFSKSSLPNSGSWCWSAAPFTLHLACSQLINTNLLRADDCSFLFTLFSTQKTRLLQMFLTLSTRLYTTLTLNQLNHSHNLLHFHSYNLLFSILIKSLFNSQLDPFFTNKRNISPQCLLSFSISCTRETSMFHVCYERTIFSLQPRSASSEYTVDLTVRLLFSQCSPAILIDMLSRREIIYVIYVLCSSAAPYI